MYQTQGGGLDPALGSLKSPTSPSSKCTLLSLIPALKLFNNLSALLFVPAENLSVPADPTDSLLLTVFAPGLIKFREAESGMVDARGWGGQWGLSGYLRGTEFGFAR